MNDSAITANYTLLYFIVPEGTSPDFIDLVSTFLFLAFFNKDKSGQRKNILTKAYGSTNPGSNGNTNELPNKDLRKL